MAVTKPENTIMMRKSVIVILHDRGVVCRIDVVMQCGRVDVICRVVVKTYFLLF